MSVSIEQEVNPSNLETRDFQTLEEKKQTVSYTQSREKAGVGESDGLFHAAEKIPNSIASLLTNIYSILLNVLVN